MDENLEPINYQRELRDQAEKMLVKEALRSLVTDDKESLLYELQLHQIELQLQNEELLKASAETSEALAKFSELYEYAPVSLLTIDKKGIIKNINKAGCELFETTRNKLINKRIQSFISEESADQYFYFTRLTGESNVRQSCEVEIDLGDGKKKNVLLQSILLDKKIKGDEFITAIMDITERKQAAEELLKAHSKLEKKVEERTRALKDANNALRMAAREKAKATDKLLRSEARLKEMNENKNKFLGLMAHDLRTPISGLKGFANLLVNRIDQMTKEEVIQAANHIQKISQNFDKLVNDMLTWSNLQMEGIHCGVRPLSIKTIIEEALDVFSENIIQKQIKVSASVESIIVMADVNMLRAVLRNLISNAVKFSKITGEIEIKCQEAGDFLIVKVSDFGIGIPERVKQRLFKLGEITAAPGTANEKGSGLGLILTKEFIERQGGNIWFESEQGKGTTFFFSIPKLKDQNGD